MKNLYLIIGPSGSGKTTLEHNLCDYFNAKAVRSFTTRLPRKDGDTDHYYVTDAEFDALGELVAFTEYDGHRYGVTKDILDRATFYVIDPDGAFYLIERYTDKPIRIIWLRASIDTRVIRMAQQGRSKEDIMARVSLDDSAFNDLKVYKLAKRFERPDQSVHIVTADFSKSHVLVDAVMYVIEQEEMAV